MARFLKTKDSSTVYENLGNGVLRGIASPEEFQKLAGTNDIAGNTKVYDNIDQAYLDEINPQVQAQVDPELNLLKNQANQNLSLEEKQASYETELAKTSNQRLQEALSKVYQDRAKNDPLARQGIVSGAARDYQTDEQVKATREVGDDLTSKLSYIAQKLGSVRQNTQQTIQTAELSANQKRQGLTASLINQYKGNNQSYQEAQAAAKRQAELDRIAEEDRQYQRQQAERDRAYQERMDAAKLQLERQKIAQSATPKETNAEKLQKAVAQAIASGQYTASGESGKQSREALISQLTGQFAGSGINNQTIQDAVYGNFRNTNEGAYIPGVKNTADERKRAENATTALTAVDRIQSMFSTNKAANATRLNPLNQEGRLLESDIRSAIDVLGFLRTGATLTEEQAKTYRNLFPTYLDTAATAKVKLDRLREEFNRAGATVQNASQGQTSFDINSLRNKYGY